MTGLILPPYVDELQWTQRMRTHGYAVLAPSGVCRALNCELDDLQTLESSWHDLPLDHYLKDGGRYRHRRHSCFTSDGVTLMQVVHRSHWQPVEYNALHGGMERWFEPMSSEVVNSAVWHQILNGLSQRCSELKPNSLWYIEAHQFRINTIDGIGRPTPEGAHRDGVDFVAVLVIDRQQVKGGETRVFQAHGTDGQRFTLTEPWTLLFLDDEQVIHESTPIQPLDKQGYRDTLVLTFRAHGFQGDGLS